MPIIDILKVPSLVIFHAHFDFYMHTFTIYASSEKCCVGISLLVGLLLYIIGIEMIVNKKNFMLYESLQH